MSRIKPEFARLVSILLLFALAVTPACANEFMFSGAAAIVIGPAFLLWFVIGLILRACGRKIEFIGVGAALVVFISVFIIVGHFEIAISCWIIYLALVTIRVALEKKRDAIRRVNLIFHGSFLAIVIVGGSIAKAVYWSNNGGFAAWAVQMREAYPGFLSYFIVAAMIVFAWIIGGKVKE